MLSSPHNSIVLETKAHLGPNSRLGSASGDGTNKYGNGHSTINNEENDGTIKTTCKIVKMIGKMMGRSRNQKNDINGEKNDQMNDKAMGIINIVTCYSKKLY